jgi:hypothetical protein
MKKLLLLVLVVVGCSPTVKIETSDKPIEINLNVNIEHNIRVKIDKQLDDLVQKKEGIF